MGRNQHCHYWRLNGGTCSLSAWGCPCLVLPRLWASAVNCCPQEFFYLLRQKIRDKNTLDTFAALSARLMGDLGNDTRLLSSEQGGAICSNARTS